MSSSLWYRQMALQPREDGLLVHSINITLNNNHFINNLDLGEFFSFTKKFL
jgi:hypothetical protein